MNQRTQSHEVAVVLAAHGSSQDVRINRPMFELAERIATSGKFGAVTPAFLDGQPSVEWVLDEIQQKSVVVVPFMTSCGYYTNVVFRKHLQSPGKRVRFAEPIGVHPQLAELVHADIQSSMLQIPADETSSTIIVGHGTRRNKQSCLTTIQLVRDLRQRLPDRNIKFAFIDQKPSMQHVVATTPEQNFVVVPFLLGLGPHTTSDVPQAFGTEDLTQRVLDDQSGFPLQWQAIIRGETRNVFFARPVGTYRAWEEICIALATEMIHKEVAA